jgi:hypothetical protein
LKSHARKNKNERVIHHRYIIIIHRWLSSERPSAAQPTAVKITNTINARMDDMAHIFSAEIKETVGMT